MQIYGPWGYAELLGDVSKGATDHLAPRFALFAALLTGAIIAGRTSTRARLVGPLRGRALRCLVGGFIMGIGFRLGPGSFGGLTLYGQPLLLPYAWVVMVASYAAIVFGVIYMRSRLGAWITARRD